MRIWSFRGDTPRSPPAEGAALSALPLFSTAHPDETLTGVAVRARIGSACDDDEPLRVRRPQCAGGGGAGRAAAAVGSVAAGRFGRADRRQPGDGAAVRRRAVRVAGAGREAQPARGGVVAGREAGAARRQPGRGAVVRRDANHGADAGDDGEPAAGGVVAGRVVRADRRQRGVRAPIRPLVRGDAARTGGPRAHAAVHRVAAGRRVRADRGVRQPVRGISTAALAVSLRRALLAGDPGDGRRG